MKKYLLLLFCLCACFVRGQMLVENLTIPQKKLLEEALTNEVQNKYASAAKSYEKLFEILKRVSDRADCKHNEAQCWFKANDTNKASKAYQYLVRNYALYISFSDIVPQLRLLAERFVAGQGTFWGISDIDEAIKLYNIIILEAPAIQVSLSDRQRLADLYWERDKYSEAIAVYLEALKMDESQDDMRLLMCQRLMETTRYGDGDGSTRRLAQRHARRILQGNPWYPRKDEVLLLLAEIEEIDAFTSLELGKFYLRPAHFNVRAARRYLTTLASKYPDSRAGWEANNLLEREKRREEMLKGQKK